VEAAQRDLRHFGEVYERYFSVVYAFALSRTHDRTLAEDVTSETFRRALQGLSRFQWRDVPFTAWLIRIATNAWLDTTRRERLTQPLETDVGLSDSRIDAVEERALLFDLVAGLPQRQQAVLVLRFLEDRSIREVAALLSISEGAVKQLQQRALAGLRHKMPERKE
jgi:RNA polymerase sigma-70 factor (ECF subfamily)